MTAMTMGMGGYAKRIEDAWLRKEIARKDLFEDGPLVFKTARQGEGVYDKSDRLLIALCNRRKEGLWHGDFRPEDSRRWYEVFSEDERIVVRQVGRTDWAKAAI